MSDRMPSLPSGCVDFNVLHDALAKGESPEAAIEKAVIAVSEPTKPARRKPEPEAPTA